VPQDSEHAQEGFLPNVFPDLTPLSQLTQLSEQKFAEVIDEVVFDCWIAIHEPINVLVAEGLGRHGLTGTPQFRQALLGTFLSNRKNRRKRRRPRAGSSSN
jgi:hypothetical protein